jgi:hypothetical protein
MTVPLANHHWDKGGHEPDRRGNGAKRHSRRLSPANLVTKKSAERSQLAISWADNSDMGARGACELFCSDSGRPKA